MQALGIHDVPKIGNGISHEHALAFVQSKACFFQTVQNLLKGCQVLLLCLARHQDVIQVHYHTGDSL